MNSPLDNLLEVARALEELRDQVVFVGGATLALLVIDAGTPAARTTDDVDAILRIESLAGYQAFCRRLRELGFREDSSGPVCRWLIKGMKVDFMSPVPEILGFTNRWYDEALRSAETHTAGSLRIRFVSGPYALATKLEAFDQRGDGDFAVSHDLEDFIAIVDGRERVLEELRVTAPSVRAFVANRTAELLNDERFLDALPGHLPGDQASQARIGLLLKRLRNIADL